MTFCLPSVRAVRTIVLLPCSLGDIEQLLEQRTDYPPEDRRLLARLSAGSLGKALTIDLTEYRQQREEMIRLVEACSRNFLYSNAARATGGWLDKRQAEQFDGKTEILFTLLRDLYLLKLDPESTALTHADLRAKLSQLASHFSFDQLAQAARALDSLEAGARRNLNRSLAIDQLVFRLGGVLP